MTETANDVIVSALQEIVVQASEAPIEADEAQDAIKYMNRMMDKFAAQGIKLGYTKVSSLGDDVTVPDGAVDGVVANLSLALKPQFGSPGTPTDPVLFERARDGLDAMRMLSIESIGPTFYPETLPVGSGNEGDNSFGNDHFYPDKSEEVITEQGGFISIEQNTELP